MVSIFAICSRIDALTLLMLHARPQCIHGIPLTIYTSIRGATLIESTKIQHWPLEHGICHLNSLEAACHHINLILFGCIPRGSEFIFIFCWSALHVCRRKHIRIPNQAHTLVWLLFLFMGQSANICVAALRVPFPTYKWNVGIRSKCIELLDEFRGRCTGYSIRHFEMGSFRNHFSRTWARICSVWQMCTCSAFVKPRPYRVKNRGASDKFIARLLITQYDGDYCLHRTRTESKLSNRNSFVCLFRECWAFVFFDDSSITVPKIFPIWHSNWRNFYSESSGRTGNTRSNRGSCTERKMKRFRFTTWTFIVCLY